MGLSERFDRAVGSQVESAEPSIVHLVQAFVAGIPGRDSGLYVEPNDDIRRTMNACATSLMTGAPVSDVTARAEPLGYEAVSFHDKVMDRVLSVLRPRPGVVGSPPAHWGLFAFSTEASLDVVIQAPHPVHDTYSGLMAAQAFQRGDARALFVAGAHPYSSGTTPPIADVARYAPTVFNDVHRSALTTLEPRAVIQFHGYGMTESSDHTEPDTPGTVNVIISAGLTKAEHGAQPRMVELIEAIKDDVRGTRGQGKPAETSVRFLPNRKWVTGLMGETNEQRKVIRRLTPDVPFVHVEADDSIRLIGPSGTWDSRRTGRLGMAIVAALVRHIGSGGAR